MSPLSPAAEAIWEAYNDVAERVGVFEDYGDALAAAFQALADQVLPEEDWPDQDQFTSFADWNLATERCDQRKNTRSRIVAIAAELEGK